MLIEILEPRIAPAGVVDIISTAKTLTIKDIFGGDSILTVAGDATGSVTITAGADTLLRLNGVDLGGSTPAIIPFFTGTLNVALGLGTDNLTMSGEFPKAVKVDLGSGTNALSLDSVSVLGAFTLKGGSESEWITLGGVNSFANSLSIDLGSGNDTVTSGISLTVGKHFTVKLGTGQNTSNLNFQNAHFGGNVLFTGNGSGNQLSLGAFNDLTIGGSVTLNSVAPIDGESLIYLSGGKNLYVGGNVTMKTTDTSHVVAGIYSFQGSIRINGNVSINTGTIPDVNPILVAAAETLFIGKSLTILSNEDMRPEIRGTSVTGPSFIGGAVTVKGARTAIVALDGTIAGKVNIVANGDHPFPVTLSSGTPDGRLRLLSAVNISTYGTGAATTLVDNIYSLSSVTIKDGVGARTVAIQDSLILGALTVDTGDGIDRVRLEATGDPGSLFLAGPVSIKTGAGLDIISFGGSDPGTGVTAIGKIFIDGGPDLAEYGYGGASSTLSSPVVINVVL